MSAHTLIQVHGNTYRLRHRVLQCITAPTILANCGMPVYVDMSEIVWFTTIIDGWFQKVLKLYSQYIIYQCQCVHMAKPHTGGNQTFNWNSNVMLHYSFRPYFRSHIHTLFNESSQAIFSVFRTYLSAYSMCMFSLRFSFYCVAVFSVSFLPSVANNSVNNATEFAFYVQKSNKLKYTSDLLIINHNMEP